MSVLIKGFEKPDHCLRCPMRGVDDECVLQGVEVCDEYEEWEQQMANCPIVPVPPHGRLGDLDALINKIGENIDKAKDRSYDWWYACTVAYDFALAAPTIIAADKQEDE